MEFKSPINHMKQPKKLIRNNILQFFNPEEYEVITDTNELNKLFGLKIQEELLEIQAADHKDIVEFADLFQVVINFAEANGINFNDLVEAASLKRDKKGDFSGNHALNNMNPENPSNSLYFK